MPTKQETQIRRAHLVHKVNEMIKPSGMRIVTRITTIYRNDMYSIDLMPEGRCLKSASKTTNINEYLEAMLEMGKLLNTKS